MRAPSLDVRLARRAAAGDERAFSAIYRRYHQDLYRFCLSILGRPEDAQDALQNTMVKALRSLPGERREIQLKPWLYAVAHNESIDLLRRRREGPELEAVTVVGAAELTESIAQRERLRRLLSDLDQLPERQRSALLMRELGGLDYEQIGEALGSSSAVARQTVYEARLGLTELEQGREMSCDRIKRRLSEADGRVTRRRDIRAHLRSCAECRAFRDSIGQRGEDLAALAPLPAAAAASILHACVGGNAAAGGGLGGAAGAAGAGAGKAATASLALKAVATVAVVATVGVTAADRSGIVDAGLPGGGSKSDSGNAAGAHGAASSYTALERRRLERRRLRGEARRPTAVDRVAAAAAAGSGRRAQGESSPPGAVTPDPNPAASRESRAHRAGPPAHLPEASRHGQGTAAAHKATHSGRSDGHSSAHAREEHPPPSASKATEAKAPPTEPPGQAKSEAAIESRADHVSGKAVEPEASP